VDGEEDQVVGERIPELARPVRIVQKGVEILQPDEAAGSRFVAGIEAEADGVDERVDREQGVDRKRRREEHRDVDGKARTDRNRIRPLHARGREIRHAVLTSEENKRSGLLLTSGPPRS